MKRLIILMLLASFTAFTASSQDTFSRLSGICNSARLQSPGENEGFQH